MFIRLLLFPALLVLLTPLLHSEEIRRVDLDGKPQTTIPAQDNGKDGIARMDKFDPSLEIFPTKQEMSHGTVIISPGGGYNFLAVDHEGRNVAKMLNEAGWDAAVLLYHVKAGPQTRELAIADAKKALLLVQEHGTDLGLHRVKIGVLGFSAGGHLTARLAHETAEQHPPDFVVLIYPAYLDKDGKVLDEVAPVKPSFVYVAADDQFSAGSRAYEAAAKEKGIRCELHIPATGGHGFGLKEGMPEAVREWPELLRKFLTSLN